MWTLEKYVAVFYRNLHKESVLLDRKSGKSVKCLVVTLWEFIVWSELLKKCVVLSFSNSENVSVAWYKIWIKCLPLFDSNSQKMLVCFDMNYKKVGIIWW